MTDRSDAAIRRAIGGDSHAISWIADEAQTSDDALIVAADAVLQRNAAGLARAGALAVTIRDRQVVEIARADLAGETELVDALARDHLVDHPDSLVVAWIAADAVRHARQDPSG